MSYTTYRLSEEGINTEKKMPVGMRFSLLQRSFRRKLNEILSEKDLTGVQFGVLGELIKLEKRGCQEIKQRDLEEASHVSHATMAEIIKRLEKKGFICCRTSLSDRRQKLISSTEKAHSLGQEIDRINQEVFSWLCRGLSQAQVEEFLQIMDVMLKNAAEDCGKGCEESFDKNACKKYKRI